jgi:hypothetical protein
LSGSHMNDQVVLRELPSTRSPTQQYGNIRRRRSGSKPAKKC